MTSSITAPHVPAVHPQAPATGSVLGHTLVTALAR
jgi:hypothetical protein